MSQTLCRPINAIQSRQDNCVRIANINLTGVLHSCDNCNQSIIPCGPDEVSKQFQAGPIRVLWIFTEGYINQEHTGFVCIRFENLVSG